MKKTANSLQREQTQRNQTRVLPVQESRFQVGRWNGCQELPESDEIIELNRLVVMWLHNNEDQAKWKIRRI